MSSRIADPARVIALLTAAVSLTLTAQGGFSSTGESLCVLGAGAALCAAALLCPGGLRGLGRWLAALAALTILSALGLIWGPSEQGGWVLVLVAYLAAAAAAFAAARALPPGRLRLLWLPLLAAAATQALAASGSLVVFDELAAIPLEQQRHPAGTMQYPPALVTLLLMALPMWAALAVERFRPWVSRLAAAGALLSVELIAVAGSRAGLVIGALALALIAARVGRRTLPLCWAMCATAAAAYLILPPLLAHGTRPEWGWRALAIAGILAFGLAAWELLRRYRVRGGGLLAALAAAAAVAALVQLSDAPSLTHGRLEGWSKALAAWSERPWLGYGTGGYPDTKGADSLYAHSLPLQIGVELGLAGLGAALALYAASLRAAWRGFAERRVQAALGWAIGVFLAFNLFDWSWYLPGIGLAFAICLGALAGAQNQPCSGSKAASPPSTSAGRNSVS